MKFFFMEFCRPSRKFFPLRPKYLPQHPILKHPQPSFFSQRPFARFNRHIISSCKQFWSCVNIVPRYCKFDAFPKDFLAIYLHTPTHAHAHTHTHTHTHTHIYIYIYNLRSLKFTLKHLKRSYMFRSHDHPQGAYIVPC